MTTLDYLFTRTVSPSLTGRLDENGLYRYGVAPWRASETLLRTATVVSARAEWAPPPQAALEKMHRAKEAYFCDRPVGHIRSADMPVLLETIENEVNRPDLVPGIACMGYFKALGVELQNGAFDDAWHHDGLSGKREKGHAGDYFAILYLGRKRWQPSWGGNFDFGVRRLDGDWATKIGRPSGIIRRILPEHGTVLLAVNNNPRFLHRAGFLRAPVDRLTFIIPLKLMTR